MLLLPLKKIFPFSVCPNEFNVKAIKTDKIDVFNKFFIFVN